MYIILIFAAIGLIVFALEYQGSTCNTIISKIQESLFPLIILICVGVIISYLGGRLYYHDKHFSIEEIQLLPIKGYDKNPYVIIDYNNNGRKQYTVSYNKDNSIIHEKFVDKVTLNYTNLVDTPYIAIKYFIEERNEKDENNWFILAKMDFNKTQQGVTIYAKKSKTFKEY